jgi:acyl-coenzyme A synthetase/AMP-(fatty) acid ligase
MALDNVYDTYMEITDKLVEHHDVLECAAVMVIQALSIYRTVLDADDYELMVKSIYKKANSIPVLNINKPTLQ